MKEAVTGRREGEKQRRGKREKEKEGEEEEEEKCKNKETGDNAGESAVRAGCRRKERVYLVRGLTAGWRWWCCEGWRAEVWKMLARPRGRRRARRRRCTSGGEDGGAAPGGREMEVIRGRRKRWWGVGFARWGGERYGDGDVGGDEVLAEKDGVWLGGAAGARRGRGYFCHV
ncbi:hypothetical protein MRB53_032459 [Persea americana]|uniref:Uncharacterized protein n=1 Tax=Persea americana TaxID=3435 RepID=A0ACC2KRW8_PERAE|nr:hypothetical protein MRB53_032459 [Persea americana]